MQISRARSGARILGLALAALAIAVPRRPGEAARPRTSTSSCWPSTTSTVTSPEHAGHDPDRLLQPGRHADAGRPAGRRRPSRRAASSTSPRTSSTLRAQNPNTLRRRRGRHDRRQPADLGAVPRRADDRGAELDRPRRTSASATTSSTRASTELQRMQYGGCQPAATAATRSTAARTDPFAGALPSTSPRTSFFAGTGKHDLPALRDQEGRRRQDRLHRPDLRGHADRRDAVRRRGPRFRDEVATPTRSCTKLKREQDVKAFVVLLHQGGTQVPPAPAARPGRPADAYMDVNKCVNFIGPEMQDIAAGLDKRDRRDRLRATRTSRTSAGSSGKLGDQRGLVRPRGDRHRPHDRPQVAARSPAPAPTTRSSRRTSPRTRPPTAIAAEVHDARRPRSPTRSSARSRPTSCRRAARERPERRRRAADGRRDRRRACSRRPRRATSAAPSRRS